MSGLDELIRFLRARYDEAEALAKATAPSGERWSWRTDVADDDDGNILYWGVISAPDVAGVAAALGLERGTGQQVAEHIALHDPDAVLRSIAGKRRIVDMAEQQHGYHLPEGVNDGRDPDEQLRDEGMQVMLAEVLHHLAEEFAAHPEYNAKEWGEFV